MASKKEKLVVQRKLMARRSLVLLKRKLLVKASKTEKLVVLRRLTAIRSLVVLRKLKAKRRLRIKNLKELTLEFLTKVTF